MAASDTSDKSDKDIPPIPKPTRAQAVPPVEPAPAVPPPPASAVYSPPPPPQYGYAAPGTTPAYPAQPAYPVAYGAVQPQTQPQGLALASMILGIVGLFIGLPFNIAAIVTGHLAQRRNPQARGFWIAGLITGYVGLVFWAFITLIFVIAIIASATSANYYGDF